MINGKLFAFCLLNCKQLKFVFGKMFNIVRHSPHTVWIFYTGFDYIFQINIFLALTVLYTVHCLRHCCKPIERSYWTEATKSNRIVSNCTIATNRSICNRISYTPHNQITVVCWDVGSIIIIIILFDRVYVPSLPKSYHSCVSKRSTTGYLKQKYSSSRTNRYQAIETNNWNMKRCSTHYNDTIEALSPSHIL